MAANNFDASLKKVLVHEGLWSNHPSDPGGATMRGIIQRVYDGYRGRKKLPLQSVRHITDRELKEIYRQQYWNLVRGDDLPVGVDYCVFDGAVNSGTVQAAKWLQRAVGATADGAIGEMTLAAVRNTNPEKVIKGTCAKRLAMLKTIRHKNTGKLQWPIFGKGWGRRVEGVERDALAMVRT